MAVKPELLLRGVVPDAGQIAQSGLALGENIAGAIQARKTKQDQAEANEVLTSIVPFVVGDDISGAATAVESSTILDDRDKQFFGKAFQAWQNGNKKPLEAIIAQSNRVLGVSQGAKFIGTPQRTTKGGKDFLTGVVQNADGSFGTQTVPVEGEFVSPLGETAAEEKQRKVETAGESAQAVADVKLKTEAKIAGKTAAAKAAIKKSTEAFDKLQPISTAIANIDEGIDLIDQGAKTGVVLSKLPSIKKASIELDNLQGRLGLDVLNTTTFGALSAGELAFALKTALPKNLGETDLRAWLVRKKEAQQKLANYIADAATFLGTPGNTITDFIEIQKVRELDRQAAGQEAGQLGNVLAPAQQPPAPASGFGFKGFK